MNPEQSPALLVRLRQYPKAGGRRFSAGFGPLKSAGNLTGMLTRQEAIGQRRNRWL